MALLLAALSGCATPQTKRLLESAPAFPQRVELSAVPFFAQEAYQCGPAALATVLNNSGLNVTPDELGPQVYVPARQGSLQFELLAAARRYGRVPYVLRPQLEILAAEVAAGNPVLVLQNLGIAALPFWHYAVVVGFDLARADIVLRSGRERRLCDLAANLRAHLAPRRLLGHRGFAAGHAAAHGGRIAVSAVGADAGEPEAMGRCGDGLRRRLAALAAESRCMHGSRQQPLCTQRPARRRAGVPCRYTGPSTGRSRLQQLAQVLADQQRWSEAEQAAQKATEIGGDYADVFHQMLAHIQSQMKNP